VFLLVWLLVYICVVHFCYLLSVLLCNLVVPYLLGVVGVSILLIARPHFCCTFLGFAFGSSLQSGWDILGTRRGRF